MTIIFHGIQFGLLLALLIGPVFFTIIQTSIERGFSRGALVIAGVSLSDLMYVVVCYFGVAQAVANQGARMYLSLGGGILLIAFGLYHLFWKTKARGETSAVHETSPWRYVVKGFLMNTLTPTVFFFWVATVSLATIDFGYDRRGPFMLFFGFLLATVLATDLLKAWLAGRLQRLMTASILRAINIVLGIALVFFGIKLLLSLRA